MSQELPGDGRPLWFPYIRNYEFYDPIIAGSIDGTDVDPHDRAIVRALSANYKPKYQFVLGIEPKATLFLGRLPYSADVRTIREAIRQLTHTNHPNRSTDRPVHRSHQSRHPFDRSRDSRRRSRSPFASPKCSNRLQSEDDRPVHDPAEWPKIRLVRNLVTGYPCGYGFAYFQSAEEANHVLRNWLRQTRSHSDKKVAIPGGLNIPDGEKVILEPAFSETLPGWKPRRLGGGLGGRKEAGQLRFGGIARPFRRPFNV